MLSGFDHTRIKIEQLQELLNQYEVRDIIITHKIKKYMEWLGEKSRLDARLQLYWHRRDIKKAEHVEKEIK